LTRKRFSSKNRGMGKASGLEFMAAADFFEGRCEEFFQ